MVRQHPAICMAARKELHFFDDDRYFAGPAPDYDWYHAQFEPGPDSRVMGEATPVYMYWKPAAERMWRYNPALKLVIILRNPIERAWSHWRMTTRRGEENLDFSSAIRAEDERLRSAAPGQDRFHSYLDRGRYAMQIARLRGFFPKEQMLVLRNDDLLADPQSVMARLCRFLEVPEAPARSRDTRSLGAGEISVADRTFLADRLRQDLETLEKMLEWDCGDWRI